MQLTTAPFPSRNKGRRLPKFWAFYLTGVTAAATFAAVTAVSPVPHGELVIEPAAPTIVYGGEPQLDIKTADASPSAILIYATRWRSDIYQSSGPINEFLDADGELDPTLLMSLATKSEEGLAAAYLKMVDGESNSAIILRDPDRERDVVHPFSQQIASASRDVQVTRRSWRGHDSVEYVPLLQPARGTIIFLGGTDGRVGHPALREWAALGIHVVSLPWVQAATRTPGCLDRVDLDLIARHIARLADQHATTGPVSLVGFSGGADAALMVANRGDINFHSVHAISPTAWHFNGATGPGCLVPSSPWTVGGKPVPYSMNFAMNWRAPFNLISRAMGGVSQNTLAREALKSAPPALKESLAYDVSAISSPAFLYAGALDDLTPASQTLQLFCRKIAGAKCYTNARAGHDIFGTPSQPVYCKSPREALRGTDRRTYCLETARARQYAFHTVGKAVVSEREVLAPNG